MKTIAIDNNPIVISSLIVFANSNHIKNKINPLSDPADVETFGNLLISRISNILCDIADSGDRVVLCLDTKDSNSKYWRHNLKSNRVSELYKLNRDASFLDNVNISGLNDAKAKYFNWCSDNNIQILSTAGFEADDIIAELVSRSSQAIIISPDGDFNQLITTPNIIRIDPIRWRGYKCDTESSSDWFGDKAFEGMWADSIFKILEITDISLVNANYSLLIKILMGDKSDCIPSVHTNTTSTGRIMGVGEKTAIKMIMSLFNNISDVKHYNALTVPEKTIMCNALKNPDIKDVLNRMDENATVIILKNNRLNEILQPVTALVDTLDESPSLFGGVEGVSVSRAEDIIIRTIDTPDEFKDYVFE